MPSVHEKSEPCGPPTVKWDVLMEGGTMLALVELERTLKDTLVPTGNGMLNVNPCPCNPSKEMPNIRPEFSVGSAAVTLSRKGGVPPVQLKVVGVHGSTGLAKSTGVAIQ